MRVRLLIGTCGILSISGCGGEKTAAPVNVVLISIDSLRRDHIGAYGYPKPTTPVLDRIAREGALFENVVAESSWTLPTHMTMLTGLSSLAHGLDSFGGGRLADAQSPIAERLKEAGYRTWGIYSGPYLHPVFGFGRGFDSYEGVLEETALDREGFEIGAPGAAREVMTANSRAHRTVTSADISERAIALLGEPGDRPFFLFLHYFDVHYDYIPEESLWRKFDPDYAGELTADGYRRNDAIHPEMDPRELQHVLALYDGEILHTDRHVGTVMDALEARGLAENTLIVVTSDHGDEFFEHGRKGHGQSLFDEVVRVPLLVRLPARIPPGLRIEEQVRHLDVAPTILAFAGLEADLEGTDLSAALEAGERLPALDALSTLRRNGLSLSLRRPEYKYLQNREGSNVTEVLYDLTKDPGERAPAHRDGTSARLFDEFRSLLWRRERMAEALREGAASDEVTLPSEIEEQLRALGYISQE